MKKIFSIIIIFLSSLHTLFAFKDEMIPTGNKVGVASHGTGVISQVLLYVKDFLFAILGIIAVGVFLYFGFKIITSRGNEEEFKKALMGFLYAVIGLAIIPLAWTAVKLITTLKF